MGELHEGEQTQSRDGLLKITRRVALPDMQPVYNLEVHGEHVYEVTRAGVLVHNNDCLKIATEAAADIVAASPLLKEFGKCIEFAKSLKSSLVQKSVSGTAIRLEKQGRTIVDISANRIVGSDLHDAIRVGDTVFDNLNPKGIPYAKWRSSLRFLDDLQNPISDDLFNSIPF
jgi:Papain fold toxin 2